MPSSVAAVTIGQSPRTDITGEIAPLLGPAVRLIEAGALDGLSREDIAALAPDGDDRTLVTRLRDGTEVLVDHRRILPLVQACLDRVQDEADLILMLCTGTFPSFRTRRLLLYPDRLLFQTARAVASDARLGVLTPSARQIPDQERRWREVGSVVAVRAFSPYRQGDDLEAACAALASAQVDLVVLDCLGYTVALKRRVIEHVRRPVLLARTVLARTAAEILGIDSQPPGA
ncbi:MAG: AroM family protein [Armatimonadota bacterium]|nr:AroM family protein [Armatimonadota bacterium]MDR7520246.1 AroM family protein [Armatimonadota bacterium]MDR7549418.1 AroM family protein [Armatimonadota bacterium]